jgi:hypothetical protein
VIRAALLLMGLTYAVPATACHRFARWYYPTPQRCSVVPMARMARSRPPSAPSVLPSVPPVPNDSGRVVPIPLPDMSKESIEWGGAMDSELELSMQRQKAIRQLTQEGD